ncbi:hypothetical protein [Microvirga pudoricolor]|nr:hypothetical protein [Microvirga pudoricolor]MBM6594277.1 hypothetical protein [Microvirga pudoricolor]
MCFITKNTIRREDAGLERIRIPVLSTLIAALALVSVVSTILTIWE